MIAGQRRQTATEVLTVDYADVLRQAVLNERARVLRNIRMRIDKISTTSQSSRSYSSDSRPAADFKKDVLREIGYEEQESE